MAEEDFRALVEDNRVHGQDDAAVTYQGMVLDGGHRYRACEGIGIPCRAEVRGLRLGQLNPPRQGRRYVLARSVNRWR